MEMAKQSAVKLHAYFEVKASSRRTPISAHLNVPFLQEGG
jgi:hypothetical protein